MYVMFIKISIEETVLFVHVLVTSHGDGIINVMNLFTFVYKLLIDSPSR